MKLILTKTDLVLGIVVVIVAVLISSSVSLTTTTTTLPAAMAQMSQPAMDGLLP